MSHLSPPAKCFSLFSSVRSMFPHVIVYFCCCTSAITPGGQIQVHYAKKGRRQKYDQYEIDMEIMKTNLQSRLILF